MRQTRQPICTGPLQTVQCKQLDMHTEDAGETRSQGWIKVRGLLERLVGPMLTAPGSRTESTLAQIADLISQAKLGFGNPASSAAPIPACDSLNTNTVTRSSSLRDLAEVADTLVDASLHNPLDALAQEERLSRQSSPVEGGPNDIQGSVRQH